MPLTLIGASSRPQRLGLAWSSSSRLDEHLARPGRGHQPRRQIHRVAHDGVLATERRAHLAGEDVAAVHADPVLQVESGLAQLRVEVEGEAGRVGGGVLVRDGRPEGEDELGALRGDVAADDEAVVLWPQAG